MTRSIAFLCALALACAFGMLAFRNPRLSLRAYAAQSILLGLAAFSLASGAGEPALWAFAALAVLIKGFVVPAILGQAAEASGSERAPSPFVSYPLSMLAGAGFALLSYAVVGPLAGERPAAARGFALALTLMQMGLWIMVSRRRALMQALGLLVVENGLFVAALATGFGMPMVVELGLAFDLLVAVGVLGILISRIHGVLSSADTARLNRLRG